jgi:hypothetical protein
MSARPSRPSHVLVSRMSCTTWPARKPPGGCGCSWPDRTRGCTAKVREDQEPPARNLQGYRGARQGKEARQRALQYVQMARTKGIGTLVLGMPVEAKRKFFRAAFKTITLDGQGRGTWRKRSVKAYALSDDALDTFILLHASVTRSRRYKIKVSLPLPQSCAPAPDWSHCL